MRAFMELLVALKGTISVALRRARPTTVAAGGLAVALLAVGGVYLAASGSDGSDSAGDRGDDQGTVTAGSASGDGDASDGPAAVDAAGRPLVDSVAGGAGADGDASGSGGPRDGAAAVDGSTGPPVGGHDVGGEPSGRSSAPSSTSSSTSGPTSTTSGSTSTMPPGSAPTTTQATGTTTTTPPEPSGGGLVGGLLELLGLG